MHSSKTAANSIKKPNKFRIYTYTHSPRPKQQQTFLGFSRNLLGFLMERNEFHQKPQQIPQQVLQQISQRIPSRNPNTLWNYRVLEWRPKRNLHLSKKTYTCMKRDLYLSKETHQIALLTILKHVWGGTEVPPVCQKRPIFVKRDIPNSPTDDIAHVWGGVQVPLIRQKRSVFVKRDIYLSKETYICQKRPAFVIRQTYILCIPPKNEEIALQTPRTEFLRFE